MQMGWDEWLSGVLGRLLGGLRETTGTGDGLICQSVEWLSGWLKWATWDETSGALEIKPVASRLLGLTRRRSSRGEALSVLVTRPSSRGLELDELRLVRSIVDSVDLVTTHRRNQYPPRLWMRLRVMDSTFHSTSRDAVHRADRLLWPGMLPTTIRIGSGVTTATREAAMSRNTRRGPSRRRSHQDTASGRRPGKRRQSTRSPRAAARNRTDGASLGRCRRREPGSGGRRAHRIRTHHAPARRSARSRGARSGGAGAGEKSWARRRVCFPDGGASTTLDRGWSAAPRRTRLFSSLSQTRVEGLHLVEHLLAVDRWSCIVSAGAVMGVGHGVGAVELEGRKEP